MLHFEKVARKQPRSHDPQCDMTTQPRIESVSCCSLSIILLADFFPSLLLLFNHIIHIIYLGKKVEKFWFLFPIIQRRHLSQRMWRLERECL